ncbi:MAG: DUF3108 domain-containing protein [Gammaproteobacteria bacterium]|nr:DUF3108 domain-containing protein [Gammaproteobacteria bacterium]
MRYFLSLILLLPVAATAGDSPFFREFEAFYEMERGKYEVAEVRMALRRTQDGIYRFTSHSETVGMLSWFVDDEITETSIFRYGDEGFRPVSYEYRHKGSDKNRDESITYDWTTNTAELDYRGNVSTAELTPGTVDRFLLQLAAAKGLEEGIMQQRHRVLDNGRVKFFDLKGSKPETVKVAAGTFKTRVISRADADDDKRITFWFAPELGYVPVRVEQVKKNEEPLRLNLKRIEFPTERK